MITKEEYEKTFDATWEMFLLYCESKDGPFGSVVRIRSQIDRDDVRSFIKAYVCEFLPFANKIQRGLKKEMTNNCKNS